jgi:hypothetical protein
MWPYAMGGRCFQKAKLLPRNVLPIAPEEQMIKYCVRFFFILRRAEHLHAASLFPMDLNGGHVSLGCALRILESFDIVPEKK